jgi:hypothetical protein
MDDCGENDQLQREQPTRLRQKPIHGHRLDGQINSPSVCGQDSHHQMVLNGIERYLYMPGGDT